MQFVDRVKDLLDKPHQKVALHDLAMQRVDAVLAAIGPDKLSIDIPANSDEVQKRLKYYESSTYELEVLAILVAYWGDENSHPTLQQILARLTEGEKNQRTNNLFLNLRWYPTARFIYAAGVAAVAGQRYDNLATIMNSWAGYSELDEDVTGLVRLYSSLSAIGPAINLLPEHKNRHTPANNYLLPSLEPNLNKLLWVGKRYEAFFDRFEVLFALLYLDSVNPRFAPIGRFGWRYDRFAVDSLKNPIVALKKDAERQAQNWSLFKAGMFGGNSGRFDGACSILAEQVARLGWS